MEASATDRASPVETPAEHGRSLRKAAMITAWVGAAHAVLFLAGFVLTMGAPGPEATNAEVIDYYESASSRRVMLVGLYVMPFAAIAFVWFVVALRMWIEGSTRHTRSVLQSNLQLVSGILYVALFCASAAASSVVAASIEFADGEIDPVTARQFPVYGTTLTFVFAFRMAAMFVFTTSAIGKRSGILPRWFAWSGYAVGTFLLLSASFVAWFALVFPVWLIVLSALLFRQARRIDPALRLPVHQNRSATLVRQPAAARRTAS